MECNKDEAIRVRDIAELKFAKKDLVGAKKFILKALQLYPCLDFAIQLSAVLDVHIAAQMEVGINEPEPDYYGILQVTLLSDDSTIKKQYLKLAKLVHPDKNKESMKEDSEAAFKLIAMASEVLSNKKTRSQHDSKRGEKPTAKEPPKPTHSTHPPQQQDVKWGGKPRANPQPQPEPWKQEPPKATFSANHPRRKAAAQPTPAPGAQASQAPGYTFSAQPTPAPGAQASQAPGYTFSAQPTPAPGAQASQAPGYTFSAQPTPAPGAQASQAPGYTFSAQPTPAPGAQASQAPGYTFSAQPTPAPGAQASQAPGYTFSAQPTPAPGAQASQAPGYTFSAQPTPAPGAQASQAPGYTFSAQPTPAPGAQASQAPGYTFSAQPTPAPGAQASQAPGYTFSAQPSPAPSTQASQAPGYTFSAPASPPPGAQVSQAPYTFWTPTSLATGTQVFQAPYIFWTACPFCRMQYQCMSIFLNNQVVCQNCHSSFPANDISVHPANGASAFVWPPGLWGNNNPIPAVSWVNMLMNKNHLAPPFGASTYDTFRNDLLSIFSGANPYGGYGYKLPPAFFLAQHSAICHETLISLSTVGIGPFRHRSWVQRPLFMCWYVLLFSTLGSRYCLCCLSCSSST